MLLRVKLVRCVLSVHAPIPIAVSTYQLWDGALRRAPGRAPPGRGTPRTAPAAPRRGPASAAPRDARPQLRRAFVPPRAARCPRPARAALPSSTSAKCWSLDAALRGSTSPPGPQPCPGRGHPAASPPGRGAARGPAPGRKRGKLGVSAGRRRTPLGFVQVAASPRFGLGVGSRGGGDTETPALLAMVLGESCSGCSLLPQLQWESRGEDPVPEGAERLCPVRGSKGTAEKLPPAKGSHQIASLLGAPLKGRTWSPELLIAGTKKRGACGELDSSPAQWVDS